MKHLSPAALGLLLSSCSLFVSADRDRLGPEIDFGGDCSELQSCDDHVACTNDFCDADTGQCAHEPDDDLCPGGGTCNPQDGCGGGDQLCSVDGDCVDGTGCSTGHCADGHCAWRPVDGDQDGTARCEGDCDDARPDVHPGQTEVCGNGVDDDCNGATDGDDPACQGGSCGRELTIRDGGHLEGDVRGPGASNSERCDRGAGPEVSIELILSRDSDLVISTAGSDFDTVLYVREGCDGAELACSDNRSQARSWLDSRLWLEALPAGTYTIVVDSVERGGHFNLQVDRDNPRAPNCDRPLDISGGGTVVGSVSGPGSDQGASCSTPTGPEAIFEFGLEGESQVTVNSDESDFDLIQDLQREQCGGDSPPGGCVDQTVTGERFSGRLDGGRWLVVLDGFEGQSGRYVLRFFP